MLLKAYACFMAMITYLSDKFAQNYVDLFVGAGGMSIGFKRAGYNHIFANEIDKHASSTFQKIIQRTK